MTTPTTPTTPPPARADAIVVAYHSEATITPCLTTLRADPAVGRILVVDNAPGDGTAAAVAAAGVGAVYLPTDENLGYGPGVNHARPHVDAPYVAVVNPDTVQHDHTVSRCVAFLDKHMDAALVSPTVHRDGRIHRSSEHDISVPRLLLQRYGSPLGLGIQRSPAAHRTTHRTEVVNFAFFVVRRSAFDEIGWFDDSIFLYGEELDVCRRLRRRGHEIWYLAEGRVDHIGAHSTSQLPDKGNALVRAARARQLAISRGPRSAALYQRLSGGGP